MFNIAKLKVGKKVVAVQRFFESKALHIAPYMALLRSNSVWLA